MAAESVEAKARRILGAGRLLVEQLDDDQVRALCAGDSGMYELLVDRNRASCSCAANGHCSHLLALELITARRGPRG